MSLHTDRVVVLIDMDCFYCQVEEKLESNLAGKPIAVVQYNAWKGGGIIAVNYPARDRGVTRHMRGDEAKEKCPDIELVRVPNVRGKADLTKYREAGKRVAEVLQMFTPLLQRASVDEAYLDITEAVSTKISTLNIELTIEQLKNTYIVGCETKDFIYNTYHSELHNDNNLKLIVGGAIVEEIRAAVYKNTGYKCSAGIAHNKILAKLACGINKPNKQTILPHDGIMELYKSLPIKKIMSLGGKFGNSLSEDLNITYMGELAKFSETDFLKRYDEKTATWLYNIARGINTELVTTRLVSKSIGCCKKFPGKSCLKTTEEVSHWLSELATEISERLEQDLEENSRRAKHIVINFAQEINRKDVSSSRTQILNSYDAKRITNDTFETLKKHTQRSDGSFAIKFLGLSAGKFEDCKNVIDISSFFKQMTSKNHNNNLAANGNNKIKNEHNNQQITNKKNNITNFLNMREDTRETKEHSDSMAFNSKKNIKINKKQAQKVLKIVHKDKNKDINVSDIENNTDDSLDFSSYISNDLQITNDEYSESTIEMDYTEKLKSKIEFSNQSSVSILNNNVNSQCTDSHIMNNLNKSNHLLTDNNSLYSNISNKTSPILSRTETLNTSKSFFMCYMKNLESNPQNNNFEQNLNSKQTEPTKLKTNLDLHCTEPTTSKLNHYYIMNNNITEAGNYCSSFQNYSDQSLTEELENTCPECNEIITKSEYITHLDHHLAEKLMVEEKKLFQEQLQIQKEKQIVNNSSKSPVKNKKHSKIKTSNNKRKLETSVSISTFFTIKPNNSQNCNIEKCLECGKEVLIQEFSSHLDFHAAKKLHVELNPVKIANKSVTITKNKEKIPKKKLSVNQTQSVSQFFKPL